MESSKVDYEAIARRAREGVVSPHVRDLVRKIMEGEASLAAKYSKNSGKVKKDINSRCV
jgi:hypothetical protein